MAYEFGLNHQMLIRNGFLLDRSCWCWQRPEEEEVEEEEEEVEEGEGGREKREVTYAYWLINYFLITF